MKPPGNHDWGEVYITPELMWSHKSTCNTCGISTLMCPVGHGDPLRRFRKGVWYWQGGVGRSGLPLSLNESLPESCSEVLMDKVLK